MLTALACACLLQDVQISGEAGWNGRIRRDAWIPVNLDVDNLGNDTLEFTLYVTWGAPGDVQITPTPRWEALNRTGPLHEIPMALAPGTRRRVTLLMRARGEGRLSVWAYAITPLQRNLALAELQTVPVAYEKRLVVVVGSSRPPRFDLLHVETAGTQPERLPLEWKGYQAVDALLWLDGDAGTVRTPAQMDALRRWVESGGRLIVARADVVGVTGTPLADLLPVRLKGTRQVPRLDGLPAPPPGPAALLECEPRNARVTIAQGNLPLVVEGRRAAGLTTFLAFDPSAPAFADWPHARKFWEPRVGAPREKQPDSAVRPVAFVGDRELALAAGRFPSVAVPAIGMLLVIMLVFLVVVSPFDFAFLRMLRRPEITWFTFPAYAIGFTALILAIGARFMRSSVIQRELAVEDAFEDSDLVRRRALSALLTPHAMNVDFEDGLVVSSNLVQKEIYNPTYFDDLRIRHGETARITGWSLQRGATGVAATDRFVPKRAVLTYEFVETDTGVEVTIRNDGPDEFEGAVLVTPAARYEIGAIRPGEQTVRAPQGTSPPLSREKPVAEETLFTGAPGDEVAPENIDAAARDILRLRSIEESAVPGFARDLFVGDWIASGGSVLLAFPRRAEARVDFEPAAKVRSAVALARFFKGPRP